MIRSILRFMDKMQKLITDNLFFLVSFITPKNKKIWVFGACFGRRYTDNSKYLFEWVNANKPNIKAVWITKSKHVVESIGQHYSVYHYHSWKGLYFILKAKVFVYTTGSGDILRCGVTSRSRTINLWHGTPYKKIQNDDSLYREDKINRMIGKLFFYYKKNDLISAPSEDVKAILLHAFNTENDRVVITGYPRNDILFDNHLLSKEKERHILYAPTFRDRGPKSFNFYGLNETLLSNINRLLKKNNTKLQLRPHFYDRNKLEKITDSYSHIILDKKECIQHSLINADFLITDYSSCMFDYLLLDRPIIFFPFDLEEYNQHERHFYFPYAEFAVGDIYTTWESMIENFFARLQTYEDDYAAARATLRQRVYQFEDGNSSKRVYQKISEMIR